MIIMGKVRLGIVVSEFNQEITSEMTKIAQHHSKQIGAEVMQVILVPGAFEIPLAAKKLLQRDDIDAVVTLGTVIKGGTDHDVVITNSIASKLLDISLEFDKPVSLGVSGPNITSQQSKERAKEYATRAVDAAVKSLRSIKKN